MDKIEMFRAFRRVVERGSFSAVADELRIKQSTVSKWVQALETELDVQLIERTTRAMHVTDAGRRFYDRAGSVLDAYDAALQSVRVDDDHLTGRIAINVPEVFGRLYVVPQVAKFVQKHQGLTVHLGLSDRYVRLVEEGFDLVVRLGPSEDSTLRVWPLGQTRRALVASPGYIKRHGNPTAPKDLSAHECLPHSGALGRGWTFQRGGRTHRVHVHGRITANNSEATLALCRRGMGIGLLATWLVAADLKAGRLVELLPDYAAPVAPISALTPPGRHVAPRIRALVEHLRGAFASLPA